MTVDLNTYKNIEKNACSFLYRSTVLDSFDILPIKAGAAGDSYFPNMRGYWQAGSSYSWLNGSRDMVTYNKDGVAYLYAVKTAGTTVTTRPLSDAGTVNSGWEEAATPFSMLFANFVYTDNASVAGFKWSDEVMKSPNGLLELNGKTGKITAKSGTIGGIKINENSISATNFSLTKDGLLNCTNANISNTLGDNKILLGSNGTYSGLFCYDGSSELFKLIFTKEGNDSIYSPKITITSTSGYAKADLSAGGLSLTYYDSTSYYENGFISMGSDTGEPSMRWKDRNGSYFDFGYNATSGAYHGKFIWYFSDVSVLMNSTTATKGYVYVDNGYLKIKTS